MSHINHYVSIPICSKFIDSSNRMTYGLKGNGRTFPDNNIQSHEVTIFIENDIKIIWNIILYFLFSYIGRTFYMFTGKTHRLILCVMVICFYVILFSFRCMYSYKILYATTNTASCRSLKKSPTPSNSFLTKLNFGSRQ